MKKAETVKKTGKAVNLTMLSRIMAVNLLPTEGNLITLKTLRVLKEKLSFTEREVKEWNIQLHPDHYTLDNRFSHLTVKIELTDMESDMIKKELDKLNAENKLTETHLQLCNVFDIK